VPAIVTSAAGASELIDDGVSGFVVPPGDRDAIADRLSLLARDPDRRVAMGRAGRERMRALSREVMAAAYVEAVRRLLR
jgi:glycosyltransferase involved in cell wall biosynthesis